MNNDVLTTVIFDADDTLWDTQPLYESSKEQFFQVMQRAGFPIQEVLARFEEVDHANVSKLGFSKERFPQSMRDTYAIFCTAFGQPFNKLIARQVFQIGSAVFKASPQMFDGVKDALSELMRNDVKLVLATKGDKEVQALRLRASGLRRYFDCVHILEEKGLSEFTYLISHEQIEPSRGWSVGNSVRSDINPALAAGLKAIWIPRDTWMYEHVEAALSHQLYVVHSITEVPGIVLRGT